MSLTDVLGRWEGWQLGDPPDSATLDVILDAARHHATQQPIPWCNTHDAWMQYPGLNRCAQGVHLHELTGIAGCDNISTGGPDHKWWKDQ